jgi:hypothetical protein
MLKKIEEKLSEEGIGYMRLDCSGKGLCQYYEAYGFKSKGTADINGAKLTLYEMEIH